MQGWKGKGPAASQSSFVSLSARLCLCREKEKEEGGLPRLPPAASTPRIVCWEHRALPTCPRRAWQATACKAGPGPVHSLPRSLQPPAALEGSWAAHSQPPTSWPFRRGAALSPLLLHGVLGSSFGLGLGLAGSEMPEGRLCKVHAAFIRPV